MIVALGPPDIGMSGARLTNRIAYSGGILYIPSFIHRWFWRREPVGRVDLTDSERLQMLQRQVENAKSTMSKQERAVMTDVDTLRIGLRSTRQGFTQGYDEVLLDARLCCRVFGFKVEDIRSDLPVFLWYAKQDVLVPSNHGVQLEKRLGTRAKLYLKDESHSSITKHWNKAILTDLVNAI